MEHIIKRLAEINRLSDMLHSDDPEMQNLALCWIFPEKPIDTVNREFMLGTANMNLALEAYGLGIQTGSVIKNKTNEERTKQCRSKKTTPLFYQQQRQTGEVGEETNSN